MTSERKALFWITGFVVFGVLLHALSSILLPFVAGMAIAYFLDPVADWLEKRKFSRIVATTLILLAFFLTAAALVIMLFPLLKRQVVDLFQMIPNIVETLRMEAVPWLEGVVAEVPPETMDDIRVAVKDFAGNGAKWVTKVAANIWSGGLAFFNMLSLLVITPLVAFYLLRDWDLITEKIDSWLPRRAQPRIREQAGAINDTLAAFVRGQSSVCLVLALFYGIGLTLVGLKSGLLVGFGAGFISFIPYVGAAIGFAIGVGIASFQFSEWFSIGLVAVIFLVGQTLESYVLTPRLVGNRVGLHPVWIIFALLAGGALFGFTGVLLAVPVAAVIGVLARFAITQYMISPLYDDGEVGTDKTDA